MSGYQPGRKAPNLSHYIAGLNQIPQEEDYTDFIQDDYNTFEDDLALFTDTEFIHNDIIDFDFDLTQPIPGEEEYYRYNNQEENNPSSSETAAAAAVNSLILPPPPPHSGTNKKQKLSPPSAKPGTATSLVSDVTANSSVTSSSSSSPSSSVNPQYTSAINSVKSAPTGTETTLGIPGSSIDNNPSSTATSILDQHPSNNHQQQQPIPQVGNGDMNFNDGRYCLLRHYLQSTFFLTTRSNLLDYYIIRLFSNSRASSIHWLIDVVAYRFPFYRHWVHSSG